MKAEFIGETSNDLTAVNAARVSMSKLSKEFTCRKDKPKGSDEGLLQYLAKESHWTPYSHQRVTLVGCLHWLDIQELDSRDIAGMVWSDGGDKVRTSLWGWANLIWKGRVHSDYTRSLHHTLHRLWPESTKALLGESPTHVIKSVNQPTDPVETDPEFMDVTLRETVPLLVARQRFKHFVGFTYNEVSRRYVQGDIEIDMPDTWRLKPEGSVKQGSGGDHPYQSAINAQVEKHHLACIEMYDSLIKQGVCAEQARGVLPRWMLTSYYVTGSRAAWKRAYDLRIDNHSQKEIQSLAQQWAELMPWLKEV